MARKKKQKSRWLRTLLLLLLIPLGVWSAAIVIWFFWYDLPSWNNPDHGRRAQPNSVRTRERQDKRDPSAVKRPQEQILDDDRQKLEDILKRRN